MHPLRTNCDMKQLGIWPGVCGKEAITQPQAFPLALEFESEDDRDVFMGHLQRSCLLVTNKNMPAMML